MKHALLFFLSADRLHAQLMRGGKIALQRNFIDSSEGRESFAAFLQTTKCPAYLLTDLIEEDFRHETVPHLLGNNRAALLQRKFEQFYRGTPFHQATVLKRQKTGRRDDEMLFSALTNPALITPWLNVIREQQIPLAGIYSVPQISAPLVKSHPSDYLLLISLEKFAGLRQTFLSNHRLQFSRLTPVYENMTFHDAVSNELTRTYQYLKSLSLLPLGQSLDVRILCHRNDRAELESKKLPVSADMRYEFADIEETAKQLKISHPFPDSDATQIYLHQLALRPPPTHYANASHKHHFTLWLFKRILNIASAMLLIATAVWSAGNFVQSARNNEQSDSFKMQAQQTLGESKNIIATFPNTYAPAADMKSGVLVKYKLDQYAPSPQDILAPISAVLNRHPQIILDDLAWQLSATEPVVDNTLTDVPARVTTLKGHLLGFSSDYRSALNYLEHFQLELSAQGYAVTPLLRPLDVSPSGRIANQTETLENPLDFSLKISHRPSK